MIPSTTRSAAMQAGRNEQPGEWSQQDLREHRGGPDPAVGRDEVVIVHEDRSREFDAGLKNTAPADNAKAML
jgi:hypothetical protein